MTQSQTLVLAALIVSGFDVQSAPTEPPQAVVRVISTDVDGIHEHLGSGFFVSSDGKMVTCYHVIEGARRLKVLDGVNWYEDVTVTAVSPDYDLAILSVNNLRRPVPFLELYPATPAELWKQSLDAYGLPTVLGPGSEAKRYEPVRSLGQEFRPSSSIRTRGDFQKQLFAKNIELIAINMIIYNGDSGGPLIYKDRVVGVISGSLDEGGSIAWAIPAKFVNYKYLTPVEKMPWQISDWPPLRLMRTDVWKTARKETTFGTILVAAIDRYGRVSQDYFEAVSENMSNMRSFYRSRFTELSALVSREISLKGPSFPIEKDQAVMEASDRILEEQARLLADFKNHSEMLGEAAAILEDELRRYLKALPATAKNMTLQASAISKWQRNMAEIESAFSRGGAAIEDWGRELGDPRTLGETEVALAKMLKSSDIKFVGVERSMLGMRPLFEANQAVIESLFDAEPEMPKSPHP